MMTQENTETYNGWKNYPTWAVNLWLSNDEGLYAGTLARVEASKGEGRHEVADTLKAWVTLDLTPDLGATFAADLLGYALDCVDWYEIAEAWLEDA
jgi:hypothetical protein